MPCPQFASPFQLMWRQPPRPSRLGEARRPSANSLSAIAIFVLILSATAIPASAVTWSVQAEPTRLGNGAPVLVRVKSPAKLDSLSGTWLGHQLTFTYNSSTKTWFALAGVSIETAAGKYPLALTVERETTKAPLTFTHTFAVARAQYPQLHRQPAVEKKITH